MAHKNTVKSIPTHRVVSEETAVKEIEVTFYNKDKEDASQVHKCSSAAFERRVAQVEILYCTAEIPNIE